MARGKTCSCGGTLKAATLRKMDLMPILGLRGVLDAPLAGYKCNNCEAGSFDGPVFIKILFAVTRAVLEQHRILTSEEARFLRKAVLGRTQVDLAKQMGINAITVADWERGERPLSKEHDYELRGMVLATSLLRAGTREAIQTLFSGVLKAPRTQAPPKRAHRYRVSANMLAA
jgi:hypothetical protein